MCDVVVRLLGASRVMVDMNFLMELQLRSAEMSVVHYTTNNNNTRCGPGRGGGVAAWRMPRAARRGAAWHVTHAHAPCPQRRGGREQQLRRPRFRRWGCGCGRCRRLSTEAHRCCCCCCCGCCCCCNSDAAAAVLNLNKYGLSILLAEIEND